MKEPVIESLVTKQQTKNIRILCLREVEMVDRFEELKVWQLAHELMLKIYDVSTTFPIEERYNLTSQIRRAALSVPINIAEGFRRYHLSLQRKHKISL